jgi:NADPH-dependent glutamate synthase beta subunit-like oxidoreductase
LETATPPPASAGRDFSLGVEGFTYQDLHRDERLAKLDAAFLEELRRENAALHARLIAYRADPASYDPLSRSRLLVDAARPLGGFVARLSSGPEAVLFRFRRDFLQRRAMKAKLPDDLAGSGIAPLREAAESLERQLHPELPWKEDPELATAKLAAGLLDLESDFLAAVRQKKIPQVPDASLARARDLARLASECPAAALPRPRGGSDEALLAFLEALLTTYALWSQARMRRPELASEIRGWTSFHLPEPMNYDALVETERPNPALPEERVGPSSRRRRRDGFELTDRRMTRREVLGQTHYCILCHEREKDSCSKGFFDEKTGTFQKNPLGIALSGCPLDEKISEMHQLRREGDSIGALALICIDNPMCPGTGHRICNDCMKGCIFQKQEPVNIPQIETGVLTDVLALPWGVEIYGLLTRWNPLSPARPYALPFNGRKILIVGLGPAGYTLAHFLLNEGFGVVGIDGLKIEPLPADWTGADGKGIRAIRDWSEIERPLSRRPLAGFGGVSEYGITVRWDKNFLTLLHLTLARRARLSILGGVRFGGTLSAEQAFQEGFDHVAIAAGAGRPTIIGMKNNIIRGVRKASDFLMALQLTGAFKEEALANLQVELPAVVIGGGLTAIDTATELLAYYPASAERRGFAPSSTARSGRSSTAFSITARRCAASGSEPARLQRLRTSRVSARSGEASRSFTGAPWRSPRHTG